MLSEPRRQHQPGAPDPPGGVSSESAPDDASPAGEHSPPVYVVRGEQNQRDDNEDSFQVLTLGGRPETPPLILLAVADGMGGHAYGEHASRETLRKLSLALFEQLVLEPGLNRPDPSAPDVETVAAALRNAFEQASAHVRRMAEANHWGRAGSTVVAAVTWGDTAVVANLGDSPLFHYQARAGSLVQATEDHSVAGTLLRGGLISPAMARVHEGRSRLEFYVGCRELPRQVPIRQLTLEPGDLLLLCSDGVSAPLAEEKIAAILAAANGDLAGAADRLLAAALAAGETDNQTLVLWRHAGGPRKSMGSEAPEPTTNRAEPAAATPSGDASTVRIMASPIPVDEPVAPATDSPGPAVDPAKA